VLIAYRDRIALAIESNRTTISRAIFAQGPQGIVGYVTTAKVGAKYKNQVLALRRSRPVTASLACSAEFVVLDHVYHFSHRFKKSSQHSMMTR